MPAGSVFQRERGSVGADVVVPGVPAAFLTSEMLSLLPGPERYPAGLWLLRLIWSQQPPVVSVAEGAPMSTVISSKWPHLPCASVFTTQLVLPGGRGQ